MKTLILSIASIALLSSCAVSKTKLTEEGEKVKVVNTKPKKNCNAVTTVIGENDQGVYDLAVNHAINLAAKEGANVLYINDKVNNSKTWRVHATGYKCKK